MSDDNLDRATPVEEYRRNRRFRYGSWLIFLLLIVGIYLFWYFVPESPERYSAIDEHFKYGSIGSDNLERGLPLLIINVLPEVFPDLLPAGADASAGYEAFGFTSEDDQARVIGFSKRRVSGVELLGLNCAGCHASTYRVDKESPPVIVLGMPAHKLDLQGFFRFLFACVSDSRFNTEHLLAAIDKQADLNAVDRFVYKQGIDRFRVAVLEQKEKLEYWDRFSPSGPGRIDTFGPYKALFFDLPAGNVIGTSDFPSLWNQRIRQGMQLHWDGNNIDVDERNISASIGAGATPDSLDHPSLARIADWIDDFEPPPYPMPIDEKLVATGRQLYRDHCAKCHALDGELIGKVTPIEELGTDANRLESFTEDLVEKMNTLGRGTSWEFKNFRKTQGYANGPLDGLWLRSPYLHNGSVPTLWHLLNPDKRPSEFYRGSDVMNWEYVGFDWKESEEPNRAYFKYKTSERGNGNGGHEYGAELSKEQKTALIEFLKTL